ncbi:MAG: ATP-binding protein [Rhodobacteraceae bacterium]|nr:ATP-binding protein [Paracoccaceae bacterium]
MSNESGDPRRRHHETLADERLAMALIDRLTHHAHIIEVIGESYRFRQRMQRETKV